MIAYYPNADEIINGSATATGTIVTVPANRWFSADIQLSAVQSGVGTAAPNVTWNASGGGTVYPASGAVISRLEIGGLIGIISSDSNTVSVIVHGGTNGGTISFNASGTSSSCVINGFLI